MITPYLYWHFGWQMKEILDDVKLKFIVQADIYLHGSIACSITTDLDSLFVDVSNPSLHFS